MLCVKNNTRESIYVINCHFSGTTRPSLDLGRDYRACGTGYRSLHCYVLRSGRCCERIPVRTRFSAPVQTEPTQPPSDVCRVSLPGLKRPKSGAALTTHRHLKNQSYISTLPLRFHGLL